MAGLTCTGDALAVLHEALEYLAAHDAAALTTVEQSDCLRALESAEAMRTAARSSVLAVFTANAGFEDDAAFSAPAWLRSRTRVTGAAASEAMSWMRRLAGHPSVHKALARGEISVSWARELCGWTDRLPAHARDDSDTILLTAAAGGAGLDDLAALAEELRRLLAEPDQDNDDGFEDRSLRLSRHFRGSGHLTGNLTAECAAALDAVLNALGKKTGPEDLRTKPQRDHDALEEACRRLVASGCVPARAGQPTQIQLVMTLDQLRDLAKGYQCDASLVPTVTGHVDHDLLDTLAGQLLRRSGTDQPADAAAHSEAAAHAEAAAHTDAGELAHDYARELILRNATALLTGPAGLASRLRTGTLTGPAASISLPLDVGTATEIVPPHIRRAVILRDGHCTFPGCDQQPAACHVHHIIPISDGGPTTLGNCVLACSFHHLIAIHKWGWKLILNADGTRHAISPDGFRVLRSHAPP